jgi:hypothetical protein
MPQFSVQDLAASINQSGVARQNKFEAEVFFPPSINVNARQLSLRMKSLTMPGRTITTLTNDTIYGPTHELAQGLTYDDIINVTFILSSDLREKTYFDTWQEFIYDTNTYGLNFYDEYVSSMNIYQLDNTGERMYGITLKETFPKVVSPLEYSYENNSAIHDLTIGFAFKEWTEIDSPKPPSVAPNTEVTLKKKDEFEPITDAYSENFRTPQDG